MLPADKPRQRQIRVFISSTFRDMQAERDILVKRIFPQLRKVCEERAVTWTEVDLRWGITDEEAAEGKVLPLCLAEIERCRPYFIGLLGERYGWIPSEIPGELLESHPWLKNRLKYSVTELEILHGVLLNPEIADRSLFYFRNPRFVETVPEEQRKDFISESEESRKKLDELKQRIRDAHRNHKLEFAPREDYANPEALGELVLADFKEIIETLYPTEEVPDPLDQEAARQEAYAQSRRLAFVGREALLHRLDEHVSSDGTTLVLTGDSGCGKSALLAEWVSRWHESCPNDLIMQHYIGSTPESADWQRLVRRILGEFKHWFGIADDIPLRSAVLQGALNEWAAKAAGARRVILVLDGLDQLAEDGAARQLGWLPLAWPPNFRILLSALPGESLDVLLRRHYPELEVPPFTRSEIGPAVLAYFKIFSKTLSRDMVVKLESTHSATNALYLRAVLDELRQLGIHEELKTKATEYLSASGPRELYERILTRWERDFGEELVRESLILIWAARRGLSESELLDLLGKDGCPLPRATWTPLYLAAENSLAHHSGLLNFGHEFLRGAVETALLQGQAKRRAAHQRLAFYFLDGSENPTRRAPELIWHLVKAGEFEVFQAVATEPHCFVAYWANDPALLLECWAQVENNSPVTVVDAYRSLLEHPPADVDTVGPACELLLSLGHYSECAVPLRSLVSRLRTMSDRPALLAALHQLGAVAKDQNELAELGAVIHEQAELEAEIGEGGRIFARLGNLAHVAESTGDLRRALELHHQIETAARNSGDRANLHPALINQARILLRQEQVDEALDLARQAVSLARDLADSAALSHHLGVKGDVLCRRQEFRNALTCYDEAETICRRLGIRLTLGYILYSKARVLFHENRMPEAMLCSRESLTIFADLHHLQQAGAARQLLEDIRQAVN